MLAAGRLRGVVLSPLLLFAACVCSRDHAGGGSGGFDPKPLASAFALDRAKAQADLAEFARSPHIFGSPRQGEILTWLEGRIRESGLTPVRQAFAVQVPNAAAGVGPAALTVDRAGANIYAAGAVRDDAPCVVALATHIDTKDIGAAVYLGTNDSGSSTIALLQQLSYLKTSRPAAVCDVIGVFFDGEEAVLPNWSDGETRHPAKMQDNTYGSRYAAGQLTACSYDGAKALCLPAALGAPLAGKPLAAVILMDMIGSPGIAISRDANSSPKLQALAADGAKGLGKPELYASDAKGVEDDHMPFRAQGIPVLDLIDFNHLDYWHREGDDPGQISWESVEVAARLALWVGLTVSHEPKVFPAGAE